MPSPKKELKSITLLKPQVKGIELHKFPSEHAIVVEGDNLWFCHEIILGEGRNILSITNPAHLVSRRVIQFNYSPTEKTDRVIARNGIVKVTLNSHFSNSIRKKVKVEQVGYYYMSASVHIIILVCHVLICMTLYWHWACSNSSKEGQLPSRSQLFRIHIIYIVYCMILVIIYTLSYTYTETS